MMVVVMMMNKNNKIIITLLNKYQCMPLVHYNNMLGSMRAWSQCVTVLLRNEHVARPFERFRVQDDCSAYVYLPLCMPCRRVSDH